MRLTNSPSDQVVPAELAFGRTRRGSSVDESDGVVIHWVPYSQRSRTLALQLGYRLHLMKRGGYRRPWTAPFTYPLLLWRTMRVLRTRPRAVVVVAPPFVAPLAVVVLSRLVGSRVAIDIHTGALVDRRWRWSVPILGWAARRATVTLVTLPTLHARLAAMAVKALVVPDPLPALPGVTHTAATSDRPRVVAICGWGNDEPIDSLLQAVRDQPWHVSLTGAQPHHLYGLPPNVHLTGFLAVEDYAQLLADADLVVVLTTREETLLSGAWEALALGRPLVVSTTAALRSMFGPVIASAGNNAASLQDAITMALADPERADLSRTLAAKLGRESTRAILRLRELLEDG